MIITELKLMQLICYTLRTPGFIIYCRNFLVDEMYSAWGLFGWKCDLTWLPEYVNIHQCFCCSSPSGILCQEVYFKSDIHSELLQAPKEPSWLCFRKVGKAFPPYPWTLPQLGWAEQQVILRDRWRWGSRDGDFDVGKYQATAEIKQQLNQWGDLAS